MKLVVTHKPCCKRCKVFQCSQWLISRLEYGNSATLIDNIFINNPENNIVSGNIVSDTTDHFSQMCILTSHCKPFFPNNKTKVQDYTTFNAKCSLTTCRILIGIIFANILIPINRSPGQLINTPLKEVYPIVNKNSLLNHG